MADNKFTRCAPDAPNRCQASGKDGQCPFEAVPNGTMCPRHGGMQQEAAARRESLNNYRLTKWKSKVGEKANNPQIRNLADEIGIIRMMIEETLEMCTDQNKLLVYTDKIANLVGQVQRLVETSQKLDERNSELLPKTALYIIADSLTVIIGDYIKDGEQLDEATVRIVDVIKNAGGICGADAIRSIP